MSWVAGARLGPYEIVAPIGAGGMGEVYKARDTRLGRDVAIKLIPPSRSGQEELRQRFEREAKAISSLNHPHICTLYDVGHVPVDGGSGTEAGPQSLFLVMELLEGESLGDRLLKGPLPLHEALKVGWQIASALEAAHRQGIIHRDLKPGNVILTRSGAKLLDFGLARTATGEPPPISGLTSSGSQVQTAFSPGGPPLTAEGMILGTFQYMAPEQLEGAEADARTDIFALGTLLYEMVTGKRAFSGASKTSLIAAIVAAQPAPISSSMPMSPPALDHVVRRCLEKDPEDRWRSAHDVAAELHWISEAGSQAGVAAPLTLRRKSRERLAWGLAAVLGVAVVALGIGYLPQPAAVTRAFRSTMLPPADHALIPFDFMGLALSPDGSVLAFVASSRDGGRQIWLRQLSEMTAEPLPETDGASYPFWSPDGQGLGFFADGKLKTIDLRGGAPRVVADAPSGRGGSWSREGLILFAPNITSPIYRVAATGGKPEAVTTHDPKTEVTHRWPVFLPDGQHFLYLSRARLEGRPEVGRIMVAALGSPTATRLIDDASNALYVEPGYLIYGRSSNLYAWRFDARARQLEGQAVLIVPDKLSFWEAKNFIPFAAADSGTIVYLADAVRPTEMRWYDRQGRPLGALGPPAFISDPHISPDGRKIAYVQGESPQGLVDIWVRDLESGRTARLTQQSGLYSGIMWAPDSDRVGHVCQPKGVSDFCVTSLSSGGETKLLYESDTWKTIGSWLPDGRRFVFSPQHPETNQDIMVATGDGGEPIVVLKTPFAEDNPNSSPDGRWVAYTSNQTGRPEVYIRSLGGTPGQWQLSTDGGGQPRWSAGGRELFFAAADGYAMAVPIQMTPTFRPGTPVRLFLMPDRPEESVPVFEDVTPDGQRLLLNVPTTNRTSIGFNTISNWTALVSPGAD